MQTFLPYSDFEKSARCLDYRRLGKQRVEAMQILMVLLGRNKSSAWQHHPAVLMWQGYEYALCRYGMIMCTEWKRRGYKDNLFFEFLVWAKILHGTFKRSTRRPAWVYSEKFTTAHRSNLLRKNPKYYRKFWPKLTKTLPYYWPIKYVRI